MFEWIKKIIGKIPFTTEEVIRCEVCYLKATHELSLSAVDLETEQLEEMQIQICANCLKDIKTNRILFKNIFFQVDFFQAKIV